MPGSIQLNTERVKCLPKKEAILVLAWANIRAGHSLCTRFRPSSSKMTEYAPAETARHDAPRLSKDPACCEKCLKDN